MPQYCRNDVIINDVITPSTYLPQNGFILDQPSNPHTLFVTPESTKSLWQLKVATDLNVVEV